MNERGFAQTTPFAGETGERLEVCHTPLLLLSRPETTTPWNRGLQPPLRG
jgi:hypothetical protein